MDITLHPEQARLIQERLKTGRYKTVEEVIGTALYLLEERDQDEEWIEEMRKKIEEGIASLDRGEGLDGETVVNGLLEKLKQAKEAQQ